MTIRIPLTPSGAWKELSPDAAAPFEVEGLTWATATQFFLAHRYYFDKTHKEAIRLASSPAEARAMALAPSRYDWEGKKRGTPEDPHSYWVWVRFNVIRRAIHERAMGDAAFVERLVATGQEPLVLESDDLVLGQAENGWGRLLMEMRARLSRESVDTLARWKLPRWLQYPEIAAYSIGWRMGYGESYVYEFSDWFEALPGAEQERFNAAYGASWPADSDLHRASSSAT